MRNAWLNTLFKIAHKNKKIIFMGSDLGANVMDNFKKKFPQRFFMEGISEQNIIGVAAGMAIRGYIPYVNTIATFLTRRSFEQNAIDLSLHKLSVRLIGNGGGLVYGPLGPTHQAIEDISIMTSIPNMSVFAVSDKNEMEQLIFQSQFWKGPMYIRLGRGNEKVISDKKKFKIGNLVTYHKPKKYTIFSTGSMTQQSMSSVTDLKKKGYNIGLVHLPTLKPINKKQLKKVLKNIDYIFAIEEHVSKGGLGSILLDNINDFELKKKIQVYKICLPDKFNSKYGTHDELLKYYSLDSSSIIKKIIKTIKLNEKK
jgi:transketolase